MPTVQNRKLSAILFADMNERFLTAGRDERNGGGVTTRKGLGDLFNEENHLWTGRQAREPRSGWAGTNPKTKCNNER